jgi:hypothetical protein
VFEGRIQIHGLSMTPEPFQLIIGSGRIGEDVNQEISVVHKNPFGGGVSFHAEGQFARGFEISVDFVTNRLPLPGVVD